MDMSKPRWRRRWPRLVRPGDTVGDEDSVGVEPGCENSVERIGRIAQLADSVGLASADTTPASTHELVFCSGWPRSGQTLSTFTNVTYWHMVSLSSSAPLERYGRLGVLDFAGYRAPAGSSEDDRDAGDAAVMRASRSHPSTLIDNDPSRYRRTSSSGRWPASSSTSYLIPRRSLRCSWRAVIALPTSGTSRPLACPQSCCSSPRRVDRAQHRQGPGPKHAPLARAPGFPAT